MLRMLWKTRSVCGVLLSCKLNESSTCNEQLSCAWPLGKTVMTCTGSWPPGVEAARAGGPGPQRGPRLPPRILSPRPPPGGALRPPAPGGLAARARVLPARPWGRVAGRRPSRSVGRRGTSGLGGDTGPCPGGRGAKAGGGAAGLAGTARRKGRLAAASAAPGAQCRPGRGATTRGPPEQELQRRREQKRRRHDAQQLQQLQHLESL